MPPLPAGKEAGPGDGVPGYQRHRPERTLLYQLVEQYYPVFADLMAAQGRPLPEYVQREFEDYLKCGRLEHGFLRVRCTSCHQEQLVAFSCKRRGFCPSCGARRMAESAALLVDDILPEAPVRQWVLSFPFALRFLFATRPAVMGRVMGIVYRTLATHQIRKAGHTHRSASTGAVTLIQRFGSALNLNIHFHMLLLDGVYTGGHAAQAKPCFQRVKAPDRAELEQLVYAISERTGRYLERQGLLVRDLDNSYLALEPADETGLEGVLGSSITYRIAVGPQQGRKAFCLQSLPPAGSLEETSARVAKVAGFSLHAGVAAARHERQKLERLCRYVTRPAIAEPRLSLTPSGNVRYQLKTPYRDGTTHVIFEPLDFMARLAALVPRPRVNLTRYHGVFAPNSPHRALVTKAGRGRGAKREASEAVKEDTPATRRLAMTRAQRLKRVFRIDVEACQACGGAMRIIASIEDPVVRGKILAHLEQAASGREVVRLPGPRAPPDGWS
jgi:ribosomal protein S27E